MLMAMDLASKRSDYLSPKGGNFMSRRKITPEQEIINLRAKGAIDQREANCRIRDLRAKEYKITEIKANRRKSLFWRVVDFMTP